MTTKTIRAMQVLVIFLGVVILIMMGVIITVMAQRIRAASGPAEDAPWQVQISGEAVLDVALDGNRAVVTVKQSDGSRRIEIYDVRTGELIGTVIGPEIGAAP
ncbi:MAG: hypothetical protein HOB82_01915 [Alphaproteobacteria bacterium]|jgi:hypothetical protein|nr:hypothetical protein [Alphaproteobacteria bacterium]MBT4710268.1 hypothetical protein [Alphaproteobacteria bacterium]MBT5860904.1 hypothetical protein [Alphaproteobacteria bacterium]